MKLSDLSPARQDLIRLCQNVVYGQLLGIGINQGDPVLDPPPTVLIDIRLDSIDSPRAEVALADFVLREEIVRLIEGLDHLCNGVIERLEVRAGIPRRMIIKHQINGVPR